MLSTTRSFIISITRLYSPYRPSNTQLLKYQRITGTRGLGHLYLRNYVRSLRNHNIHRRNFSVNSSAQPAGAPLPSQPPSSSSSWLLGVVLTIVLPFVTNTWGSVLKIKTDVDTVVETIEEIVDVLEKVAEVVDKVAEDISDDLPEGGKFKKMVDYVEDVAEETAKDAHTIGDAIDKLQEVEEKVENIVETLGTVKGKELHGGK